MYVCFPAAALGHSLFPVVCTLYESLDVSNEIMDSLVLRARHNTAVPHKPCLAQHKSTKTSQSSPQCAQTYIGFYLSFMVMLVKCRHGK